MSFFLIFRSISKSASDVGFFRKYIDEYRVRSFSSSDPYEKILFSVCADVYQHFLDDLLAQSRK